MNDPAADGHGYGRRRPAVRGELAGRRGERLRGTSGRFHRVYHTARLQGESVPHPEEADLARLVDGLCGPLTPVDLPASARSSVAVGRRRRPGPWSALASDRSKPLHARVAALFALKQLDGKGSHAALRKLAEDAAVREFALRALVDRRTELDGVDSSPFIAALGDASPRVRAQALIALGRLGDVAAAASIIPLTARPQGSPMPTTRPVQDQPDPDRVLPHLAAAGPGQPPGGRRLPGGDRRSLSRGGPPRLAVPARAEGRRRADQEAEPRPRSSEARRDILATLVRLYHREADYEGSWWGIRPDPTGPYYRSPGVGMQPAGSRRCSRRPSSTATLRQSRSSATSWPGTA